MRNSNSFHSRVGGLALLVLLGGTPGALALDPGRTLSQYVRQRWGMEHGFPRAPVYALEQTRDGYL